MNTKVIVLLIVSVCASISEISGAKNRDICSLPLVTGMCRAGDYQWGYNPLAKKCVKFRWGGCEDGNANRFNTKALCEETCQEEKNQETDISPRSDDFVVIPGKCSCQCPKCDVSLSNEVRSRTGQRNLVDLPVFFPNY